MRAFFAIGDAATAAKMLAGRNVLYSFAYVGSRWLAQKHLSECLKSACSVRVDSGGFTAWKQGAVIDLSEYMSHLCSLDSFDLAFQLDAVGDHAKTRALWLDAINDEQWPSHVRDRIAPIYHEGAPMEYLDEYVSRARVVGLGRIEARRSELKTFEFYDSVFNRHPDRLFHALGNASPTTLEPYPFESFDSTGWQRDAAYSNAAKWPFNRCTKEARMRAYIEATETIEHRPAKQLRMSWGGQ